LTFGGCYYLSEGNTFLAAILFSLASLTRSNGVVLIGFLLYYNLRKFVNHFQVTNLKSPITVLSLSPLDSCIFLRLFSFILCSNFVKVQMLKIQTLLQLIAILVLECVETITLSVLVYLPLSAFQYYSYQLYCTNTTTTSTSRPWCSSGPFLPSFYNFVQSHYWYSAHSFSFSNGNISVKDIIFISVDTNYWS
jgi:Gpi18-like mannosyltransferase